MLQRLQDASVRLKVAAVSAIYVALCVGLGLFSLQQASWINAPAQEIRENWLPAMSKLGHLSQGLSELRLAQYAAGMNLSVDYEKWPANDKAIVAAMDNVKTRFDAVRERAIEGSTEAELMREFATVWGKIEDATKRFREAATGGDIFGAASLIEGETKALMLAAAELVRKDLEYNERGGRVAAQHSASVYGFAFTLISAAICLVTLMGIVTSVLLNRTLVAPLSRATGVVGALTEGRLDIAVSDLERKDEYGMLARALEFFRCSLMKGRQEADAAEVERIRLEAEHKAEQQRAIDAERALVVASIGGGLARLADKDLTFRLNDALPDAYAKLQSDFNHALDQLEGAMQAVSSTSQTITGGTQEVSASTDELSKRTEQQAASLEETAAALDEITATGKKSAEGAEHAREVVTTAKSDAEKTGLVVRRTIEAMGNIEKSAQKISQIIGVIDEIAFQTNLLALNAGVEAARAGEAGRGFAVVASEVRALAQRSAEAAREIKELISTSSSQVSEGVDLVAETGKALERILVQVDDINAVVVNIAAGAKEQAIGLQEVNSAINQMDQTTQQNAAMVEETTAASQSLAAELEQLTALIGQFRVTHAQARNGAVAAARAKAAPARTSGRPRPLLSKSRSAALPKAQPGTHEEARDDDWTDF